MNAPARTAWEKAAEAQKELSKLPPIIPIAPEKTDMERTLPPSPHHLSAMPRALRKSETWKQLSPGARDLCRYLLEHSNTRSFKDVWPGSKTIEADLGIDKRTRRRYEVELVKKNLLRIFEPGRTVKMPDGSFQTFKSRVFRFLFKSYINQDYKDHNRAAGKEIYRTISEMDALEDYLISLCDKLQFDASRLQNTLDATKFALDQAAKRLQIDSIDHLGRVHVRLHSTLYDSEALSRALPDNVLIFPEKKNKDFVINTRETWESFTGKLTRKIEYAQKRAKALPLLDFKSALRSKTK